MTAVSGPPVRVKRSGLLVTAGVLTIIGACVAAVSGIVGLIGVYTTISSYYYYHQYEWLVMGVFGILSCALGLTGGIFTLMRRRFVLCMIGMVLIMISGFVTVGAFVLILWNGWGIGLLFGLPSIFLSVLSIIFASVSRGDFA
ncbi:MAG TPA: hypothetical protein VMW36_11185 [Patescibacteria group bacterium]|nr:hypothetical protein [Patescibacteria group bacterium]